MPVVDLSLSQGAWALIHCIKQYYGGGSRSVQRRRVVKDNDGNTVFILASGRGHLKVVRALLKHTKVDVNVSNDDGCTALHRACENGHAEVVWELIYHKVVKINTKNDDGCTPLISASAKGHLAVVR